MNENYFVTTAEVSATLTGLIFVSLSINLHRILSYDHLPARALAALMMMANITLISSFSLVNKQPAPYLGIEVLVCFTALEYMMLRSDIKVYKERMASSFKKYYIGNIIFSQLATLPYFIAACLLIQGNSFGGLWLIPAFTFSIIKALTDSWVLLVEINR